MSKGFQLDIWLEYRRRARRAQATSCVKRSRFYMKYSWLAASGAYISASATRAPRTRAHRESIASRGKWHYGARRRTARPISCSEIMSNWSSDNCPLVLHGVIKNAMISSPRRRVPDDEDHGASDSSSFLVPCPRAVPNCRRSWQRRFVLSTHNSQEVW